MPRINQLPVASSVAQTDVLAIDTPDKTYKVPRSILAPAPYIATIPTGQWSGSGSDYYITVTASNVTADAMLYPFYDNASAALLNGPVWVIPAEGSFTIHTTAIPSGTVTISVLLAGIVGEAQYQVLSDVYSKSQVDKIVSQSTAGDEWVSVTPSSDNFTAGTIYYKKIGNVIYMTAHGLSTSKTGLMTVHTMTAGNRPARRWTVKPSYPNLSGDTYINCDTNGAIQFINGTGGAVSNLYFTAVYPTV